MYNINKIIKIKSLLIILSYTLIAALNISCTQVVVGGAASGGIILVQERSTEQAAKDILIKTKIEEAFFSENYDEIFSKIKVIVFEAKVLLVGTVKTEEAKQKANSIAYKVSDKKEIANYIVIGKESLIDYLKDTRINIEFKAKLLTDKEVSEVNYYSTTENRVLYIIGVSQNKKELDKVLYHASNIAGLKKIVNLVIDKNSPERKKYLNE
ncbi:MAG: BON domain-containing protein [Pseudomonadota bacterium]|nr:BON domain-containing protein [Pseudomonadota bacterium]